MGLFNKRDEVPDLPPAPSLPPLPNREQKKVLPDLPSFPQSTKNENLNRELVKSAVSDDEEQESDDGGAVQFPPMRPRQEQGLLPSRSQEQNMLPSVPKNMLTSKVSDDSSDDEVMVIKEAVSQKHTSSSEPIFVRIDKFQASQESFDKILVKIREIESTLEKLRKVKSQEEEELNKWSSEVEQLKSRLSDIDDNIFGQV